jgi:hypothetical protein
MKGAKTRSRQERREDRGTTKARRHKGGRLAAGNIAARAGVILVPTPAEAGEHVRGIAFY